MKRPTAREGWREREGPGSAAERVEEGGKKSKVRSMYTYIHAPADLVSRLPSGRTRARRTRNPTTGVQTPSGSGALGRRPPTRSCIVCMPCGWRVLPAQQCGAPSSNTTQRHSRTRQTRRQLGASQKVYIPTCLVALCTHLCHSGSYVVCTATQDPRRDSPVCVKRKPGQDLATRFRSTVPVRPVSPHPVAVSCYSRRRLAWRDLYSGDA